MKKGAGVRQRGRGQEKEGEKGPLCRAGENTRRGALSPSPGATAAALPPTTSLRRPLPRKRDTVHTYFLCPESTSGQSGRERSSTCPEQGAGVGLQPGTLGAGPELKAAPVVPTVKETSLFSGRV